MEDPIIFEKILYLGLGVGMYILVFLGNICAPHSTSKPVRRCKACNRSCREKWL